MPWQGYALTRALEVTPDGYAWSKVGAVVGRGSGKTTGYLAPRILHALVNRGQSVLGLAQNLSTAKETFDNVLGVLEQDPHLKRRIRRALRGKGDARIELRHPSGRDAIYRLSVTANGCRGPRADLLAIDEAAYVSDAVLSAATYVQMGTANGPWQQTFAVCTAGDDTPDAEGELQWFSRWRAAFEEGTDPRLCWLEWSLPDGVPLEDETYWPLAIPALGHRITVGEVRDKIADPAWAREVASRWGVTSVRVIPADLWQAGAVPGDLAAVLDVRRPPVSGLGVAVAPESASAALATAYRLDRGRVLVKVVESAPGRTWAVTAAADWSRRTRLSVAIDRRGPGGPLADALEQAGVPTAPATFDDYANGCDAFLDDVREGRLLHYGQPVLDLAAASARRRDVGERWVWARRAGDIAALEAATLAAAAARHAPVRPVVR